MGDAIIVLEEQLENLEQTSRRVPKPKSGGIKDNLKKQKYLDHLRLSKGKCKEERKN